jgi:hypothetical protein
MVTIEKARYKTKINIGILYERLSDRKSFYVSFANLNRYSPQSESMCIEEDSSF